ncbi:hypothetical protein SDC9_164672 [bioreactor metagenome]|uniref:Uncharacterized protein n=1 Tax=bioreactor metagenome TaxID=1076179 RepID=A0A645FUX1_9ZZZZ
MGGRVKSVENDFRSTHVQRPLWLHVQNLTTRFHSSAVQQPSESRVRRTALSMPNSIGFPFVQASSHCSIGSGYGGKEATCTFTTAREPKRVAAEALSAFPPISSTSYFVPAGSTLLSASRFSPSRWISASGRSMRKM